MVLLKVCDNTTLKVAASHELNTRATTNEFESVPFVKTAIARRQCKAASGNSNITHISFSSVRQFSDMVQDNR